MDTLTHIQLVNRIAASKGVLIVGLLCWLDARARKTNNPYGSITKVVRAVGFVGADYELAVNREALRQEQGATFKTESLPWGEWYIPNKVILHNGKWYLRTQTTPNQRRKQPAKVIQYRDGWNNPLDRELAKPFLPSPSDSCKQAAIGLVSRSRFTDDCYNQIWVRNYAFDSIQKIRIAGKTYKLKP